MGRDLPLLGSAGAAEEGDLEAPQEGTGEDVADPALGQVHDLGEQGVGNEGLLRLQVLFDPRADGLVGVAEAAQDAGSRRPRGVVHQQPEVARREGLG